MSDLSALSAISQLSEKDLYYQYLIDNNSTSTMLNALSGNSSDTSDSLDLSNMVSSVTSLYSSDNISSLLGNVSGDDALSYENLSSFYSVLQTYLNSEKNEAAQMAQTISDALEKAENDGEDTSSTSYKTVQEIYEYFLERSSSASVQSTSDVDSSSGISAQTEAQAMASEFDFDGFEEDIDEQINSTLSLHGFSL